MLKMVAVPLALPTPFNHSRCQQFGLVRGEIKCNYYNELRSLTLCWHIYEPCQNMVIMDYNKESSHTHTHIYLKR